MGKNAVETLKFTVDEAIIGDLITRQAGSVNDVRFGLKW